MSDSQSDGNSDCDAKVAAIFHELVGESALRLSGSHYNHDTAAAISCALTSTTDDRTARDIAFNLTDWASDAAFIVALQLFPERFTTDEIADGIENFLIHAPNHVSAAAVLSGHPAEDIFGITSTKSNATGKA